jgi:hypothetical protein
MYGCDILTYVPEWLGERSERENEMNEGEGKVDYIMLLARTAVEDSIICEA